MGDRLVRGASKKALTAAPTMAAADAILSAADQLGLTVEGELQQLNKTLGAERATTFSPSGISMASTMRNSAISGLSAATSNVRWSLAFALPAETRGYLERNQL